jgi:tetrahydromethanopterin:alpha-L-glutamate ligase
MTLRIAIATEEPGWHGARLKAAFAARGATCDFFSLAAASISLGQRARVRLPGLGGALPDAVFVRGVPGGSLAQVVFHLDVLHALADLGVPVFNDARAVERAVDKSLTSLRLHRAGLPTPATWVCADAALARAVVARETARGDALLCKPVFGSQGEGIHLLRGPGDLPDAAELDGVFYLQRFVGRSTGLAVDRRVMVVEGRAVAAMDRSAPGHCANVARGGRCSAAPVTDEAARLAVEAVRCLDMDYAGVDLVQGPDGRWWLIEVNSIPAWRGLQSTTGVDIAGLLADALLARCVARVGVGLVRVGQVPVGSPLAAPLDAPVDLPAQLPAQLPVGMGA